MAVDVTCGDRICEGIVGGEDVSAVSIIEGVVYVSNVSDEAEGDLVTDCVLKDSMIWDSVIL